MFWFLPTLTGEHTKTGEMTNEVHRKIVQISHCNDRKLYDLVFK